MVGEAVLLADVVDPYLHALRAFAIERGARVIRCRCEDDAAAVERGDISLCVVHAPPGDPGFAGRLRAFRKPLGPVPVVVLAERIGIEAVVQLVKSGVADVIELPAAPADVTARAWLHLASPAPSDGASRLVGRSAAIERLRGEIAAVAALHSTVLLTGETGSGKGLAAREIHRRSGRRDQPFVHVDCSSLSPSVIESELFGHERGAFTGATYQRAGRFELAREGTIFLDEIGDLELALQRKFLRVLQDREYERLGGTRTLPMRARVIAATNRDLPAAVRRGEFRADLYFRLNVVHVRVPPLRERSGDLPLLARFGLEQLAERLQLRPPPTDDAFYARLERYGWPGNVRELMNLLERWIVRGRVEWAPGREPGPLLADAGPGGDPPPASDPFDPASASVDRIALVETLQSTGGNVSRAARRLGLPRSTLRYKLDQHGLRGLIPKD